jgi:hypothetical protein
MRDRAEPSRHLEALVGGQTRWRERVEQSTVLGVPWSKLPREFRQAWWEATDYGQHPPPPEFMAWAPQLLAIKQAKRENLQRQIAAENAARSAWLKKFPPAPCEQCLRPASPCEIRCLRALLTEPAPPSEGTS